VLKTGGETEEVHFQGLELPFTQTLVQCIAKAFRFRSLWRHSKARFVKAISYA
jgi:hypothetical protein